MKKLVTIILVLMACLQGFTQTPGVTETPKGTGKISGTVVDGENNMPVEFANVALIDSKTEKVVDGTMCDDKGKFILHKIVEGTYSISITFIGYETNAVGNLL